MSEEKPIPAKMLDAAAKAVVRYEANLHSCSLRLTEEFYGEMIEVALRAAGVPELASAREAIGAALFRHGYDTGWTTQEAIECIDAMAARIAELEAESRLLAKAHHGAWSLYQECATANEGLAVENGQLAARIAELEAEIDEANQVAEARSVVGMDLLVEADQQEARIAELEAALRNRICEGCNALVANVGMLHLCGCDEQRNLCSACKAGCVCAGGRE